MKIQKSLTNLFMFYRNAITVLRQFGMEHGDFGYNIMMILGQILLFKIMAYFTLKRKIKSIWFALVA